MAIGSDIVVSIGETALPFSMLSAGQKMMVALIADIAVKAVTQNAYLLPPDKLGPEDEPWPRVLTQTPADCSPDRPVPIPGPRDEQQRCRLYTVAFGHRATPLLADPPLAVALFTVTYSRQGVVIAVANGKISLEHIANNQGLSPPFVPRFAPL
jgi:hypothetical protein